MSFHVSRAILVDFLYCGFIESFLTILQHITLVWSFTSEVSQEIAKRITGTKLPSLHNDNSHPGGAYLNSFRQETNSKLLKVLKDLL